MTVQTPQLQSCPHKIYRSRSPIRDHSDARKAGVGFVSMETSVDDSESSQGINPETKKNKSVEGSSLWHRLYIFFLLLIFFLNAVFELFVVVMYFFCHYSHQQAWSTVTQKKKCLCLVCEDQKEKEKALHIYIKKFGATRLFSGSPHSLHIWVSHGSVFSWSVTWLVICWYSRVPI